MPDKENIIRILEDARNLLEKGWCRGAYARNKNMQAVNFQLEDAKLFCAVGALSRAAFDNEEFSIRTNSILRYLIQAEVGRDILEWNDAETHENVIEIFQKVIDGVKSDRISIEPPIGIAPIFP